MSKYKMIMTILVVLLVAMGGSAWYLFSNNIGLGYANADNYQAGNTEITASVENLAINWTSGEVNIEYHAGAGIKVTETAAVELSEDQKLRWWLDGSTLRIRYSRSGININLVNPRKSLTVSLPEGTVLKKADISVTSAGVEIPALAADEIRLDTTSGDINAVTSAKKLTAASTSGALVLRQDTAPGSVFLKSTSGNISLTLPEAREIDADSTSGSIAIASSGNVEKIRVRSTSGTIDLDLPGTEKADIGSTSGGISAVLRSFRELDISATSGNVSLKLPEAPGFTLDLDAKASRLDCDLALEKNGNTYTFGDGSAKCRISTTSGRIRIGE